MVKHNFLIFILLVNFVNNVVSSKLTERIFLENEKYRRSLESLKSTGVTGNQENHVTTIHEEEEEEPSTSTIDPNDVSSGLVWNAVRGSEDEGARRDGGGKKNTTHHVVLMPGLPGLPGMPGLPGQAELQRSKQMLDPEFSNCRFNESGHGVFLCNYTVTANSEPRAMEGSKIFPVIRKSYLNTFPYHDDDKLKSKNMHNNNRTNNHHHGHGHSNHSSSANITGMSRTPNVLMTFNSSKHPILRGEEITTVDYHENITYIEDSGYEENKLSIRNPAINKEIPGVSNDTVSNSPTFAPVPIGPGSRQISYQEMSMYLQTNRYMFPDLPKWLPIRLPHWHGLSIFGSPGAPGKPGMPGTPGQAVIYGPYLENVARNPVTTNARAVPVTTITHGTPTVVQTHNVPTYGNTLPTNYPIPPGLPLYNLPVVQSSASFYGGRPGSAVSSQATTGISSVPQVPFIPPVGSPGTGVIPPPGYPGYQPGYPGLQPGYPGFQPGLPYPPGVVPPYPMYPGYPAPLGYQFYT